LENSNVQVVFDTEDEVLYLRRLHRNEILLIVISVTVLFISVKITEEINNLGAVAVGPYNTASLVVGVVLFVISETVLSTETPSPISNLSVFVSERDRVMFRFTQIYTIVVVVLDVLTARVGVDSKRGDLISAYLGLLSLVAGSFYHSFQTITQVVLMVLLLVSLFMRYLIHLKKSTVHELQALIDGVYVYVYFELFLVKSDFIVDTDNVPIFCCGTLCLAISLSEYLLIKSQQNNPKFLVN
jgi:hypothetical protein